MSKKPPSKKSARNVRRESERDAVKLVQAREKLAALEAGGSPERPLDVPSASVVETSARSRPCPQCGGVLRVDEHVALEHAGARLRVIHAKCTQCGAPRAIYFRIAQPN